MYDLPFKHLAVVISFVCYALASVPLYLCGSSEKHRWAGYLRVFTPYKQQYSTACSTVPDPAHRTYVPYLHSGHFQTKTAQTIAPRWLASNKYTPVYLAFFFFC